MSSQAEVSHAARSDQSNATQRDDTQSPILGPSTLEEPSARHRPENIQALEQRIEQQRQLHGSSAPETQEALRDLSHKYQGTGQWEKAETLQRTHADTLRSMHELAIILSGLGQDDACEKLQLEVLAKRESALGKLHEDTIESMEQLAIYYQNEQRYEKSTPLYEKVAEANTTVHGEDSIETLNSCRSLAHICLLQGRIQEAWKVQDCAYQKSLEKYGVEHDCTQGGLAGLAHIVYAQGDKEKAKELQRGVLNYHVAKFGRDDPWTEECVEDMDKFSS
jgi:tetratricopeptide (TPR) repeat protein